MKQNTRLGVIVLCVALALCITAMSSSGQRVETSALADVRQTYRSAALVASGSCVQTHLDAHGLSCSDFEIKEVLAGDAKPGSVIHCENSDMQKGQTYLAYLQKGADVEYAEDEISYTPLDSGLLKLDGEDVLLGGSRVPLTEVKAEIAQLDSVISSPAEVFYYPKLDGLVEACDEIVIGRVNYIPDPAEMEFRSQSGGNTVEHTLPAAVVDVTAYGGAKGAINYGEHLKLIYSPAMTADLVNADTLIAEPYNESEAPVLKQGGVYVFFLTASPDEKQGNYFCVNPMQGYIDVNGDRLSVSVVNQALRSYVDLNALVADVRSLVG